MNEDINWYNRMRKEDRGGLAVICPTCLCTYPIAGGINTYCCSCEDSILVTAHEMAVAHGLQLFEECFIPDQITEEIQEVA